MSNEMKAITMPVRLHCECRNSLSPIQASVTATTEAKRFCRCCGRKYAISLAVQKYVPGEVCVHSATMTLV